MNKLIIKIIFALLFIINSNIFSQYSLTIYLHIGTVSITGKASTMKFTKYPHTYPGDIVSGITVSEVGATGSYVAKGFTTYQYVKLWVDDVNQSWFDSTQTGSITDYVSTQLGNYILKAGTVTGITGNKTISSGDWLKLGGTETWYKPYLYSGSPWVTDYSAWSNNGLITRDFGDSVYGVKPYYISSLKIILLSGQKIWGTSLSQPIEINTAYFNWNTTTGLGLVLPYQHDSLYFKKDTIIDENSHRKSWSLNRNRFNQISPWDLWLVYRNTLDASIDSSQIINEVVNIASSNAVTNLDSAGYSTIQTWNFPYPAYWDVHIYYEYEFEYVTPVANCYDSIYASAWSSTEYTDPAFLMTDNVNKYAYIASTPTGQRGTGELSFQIKITPGNIGDTYSFAGICSSLAHKSDGSAKSFIRKWKIVTTKIR